MIPSGWSENFVCILGCANKELDGYLGHFCKFIEYCRIVALLPVIPWRQGITGSSATILQYSMNLQKCPKYPSSSLFAQPKIHTKFSDQPEGII